MKWFNIAQLTSQPTWSFRSVNASRGTTATTLSCWGEQPSEIDRKSRPQSRSRGWCISEKLNFSPIFTLSHSSHSVPKRIHAIAASTFSSSRKTSSCSFTMRSTSTRNAHRHLRVSAVPRTSHSPNRRRPNCTTIFVPSFCLVSKHTTMTEKLFFASSQALSSHSMLIQPGSTSENNLYFFLCIHRHMNHKKNARERRAWLTANLVWMDEKQKTKNKNDKKNYFQFIFMYPFRNRNFRRSR